MDREFFYLHRLKPKAERERLWAIELEKREEAKLKSRGYYSQQSSLWASRCDPSRK